MSRLALVFSDPHLASDRSIIHINFQGNIFTSTYTQHPTTPIASTLVNKVASSFLMADREALNTPTKVGIRLLT